MDSQLILASAFPMFELEKVLGFRSRTPLLGTSSLILYDQVWENFNFPCIHVHEDQSLRDSEANNQTFHFRAPFPPCPFLIQSGLGSISPILHFMNQLHSRPTSASSCCTQLRGSPSFPGQHKAAQVFNWRKVEMHRRSSLTLSQPDTSESLGH